MSSWEASGKTDEWYTPRYIFDALGCEFDLDVAAPIGGPRHVPCNSWIHRGSLDESWSRFYLFKIEAGTLSPWKKTALDAVEICPQIPIISVSEETGQAALRLGAGSAFPHIRFRDSAYGSLSAAPEDKTARSTSDAVVVEWFRQQTKSIFHPTLPHQMGSLRDAENATARSLASECEECGRSIQRLSNDRKGLTAKANVVARRSGDDHRSTTQGAASETLTASSIGQLRLGTKSSKSSSTSAPTAGVPVPSTKTISFRFPILDAPELSQEISSQLVSLVISQKAPETHRHGLETKLCSLGFAASSQFIGIVTRPFVWANPPFGGRNGLDPWLEAFVCHGDGIAVFPDRTSAPWFQKHIRSMDAVLFVTPKIKFEKPDGSLGESPGTGTVLAAIGPRGCEALRRAASVGLGWLAGSISPGEAA